MCLDKEKRKYSITFIISIIGWSMIYLSFVGISAYSIKFTGYHYIKMLLPVFMILSIYCIISLTDNKRMNKSIITFLIYIGIILFLIIFMLNLNFKSIDSSHIKVESGYNQNNTYFAIDKNISTRWDSQESQKIGMEFIISLDKDYLVNRVTLDTTPSPGGSPKGMDIFISIDGKSWLKLDFITESGFNPLFKNLYFHPIKTRYIKLKLNADFDGWWTIHELEVYGR